MPTRTITADVRYGADADYDSLSEWQRDATGWRVTLELDGRTMSVDFWTGQAITDDPTAADVLASVIMDAHLGDQSFADFCADLGYDPDSRRAYAQWEECRARRAEVLDLLGDAWDELSRCSDPSDFTTDDEGNVVLADDDDEDDDSP